MASLKNQQRNMCRVSVRYTSGLSAYPGSPILLSAWLPPDAVGTEASAREIREKMEAAVKSIHGIGHEELTLEVTYA